MGLGRKQQNLNLDVDDKSRWLDEIQSWSWRRKKNRPLQQIWWGAEKMTSARAKAEGLKKCKEANMADAERMEEKSSRRWSQSRGRTGRATESIIRTWVVFFFFPLFIFISWRLITLQCCSGFCHTLTWISHGFTCVPHPNPPSHLSPHPIPLGPPSAPSLSRLMHPTWAGGLFHPW